MPDAKFTHLHVHTHYSLLDGANKIPDLVRQAKKLGMDSLAITDHGCMFGVVEFFNECKKEGIKPILGMEAYMAPGDRRDKSGTPGETAYHLLLLAQNLEGYHNLLKLSSSAYRDGFYYKPRIDKDILREHHRGLIATSACLGGEIPSAFMRRGKMAEAKATVETYLDIFGPDRFFIEVQNHIKEQNEVNPELAELARKTGVGLVATNDVHFLTADDHRVHDVLCCISMGKLQSDESRLKYPKELFLKSPAEMVTALGDFDQAVENTTRIAAMCDLSLDFSKRYAPVYKVEPEKLRPPSGTGYQPVSSSGGKDPELVARDTMKDDERYLRQLCDDGLLWRYGTRDVSQAVRDRLEYEVTTIASKGFCSYFLIVWDFCNYARDNGIPVGARGSGVGSMVAFLLGLCNVDPLTYNLLFERFMDPSRNEMPDIDIDICQDGRQRVIEYVRQKYGHVAQIITFGTLAAKAACKDVGRVLGVPLAEIDKLTKLIPGVPGMTLKRAIDQVPDLDALIKSSPVVRNVIDYAMKLEGMARNAGCHAAGVIIADQPLDGIVPLYRDSDGNVLTQFEGPIAEKCGLLKMDFLGLRTLTSLTRSIDLEHETRDKRPVKWLPGQPVPEFDARGRYEIDKVDLADPAVYKLFQRGETRGVFQFESGGMQDLLMKMVPDRIEDLIAANALYRPGPMELIPSYCARKHGKEPVPQVHPIMDGILAETYGIMCIHEDARVSMADGTERPIRDVRRGDRVHSLNYANRRFDIKECHGCGPTRKGDGVRVTLENGFAVTLTDDHKVLTYAGLKEAGTLDPETDLVAIGRELAQERPSYHGIADWLGADEDVAYLLGALVGDGCLTTSGITIATGRERDHHRFVQWVAERLPGVRVHGYFHGRSWYASLSHPQLLNLPGHGNRKTRLHFLLETHGLKTKAQRKRVPAFLFRCVASVRAAFLAGLLDADGCTAVTSRGAGACFLTSTSPGLLEDVRRLAQVEGISTTVRKQRIQFWSLLTLSERLRPYLLVRQFAGTLTDGHTVGWVPRQAVLDAIPERESVRAFSDRTGIMRAGLKHDFPFCKSSTAAKAGIDLGHVRYHRITSVERVHDQQFYGMSVAGHHNLVANGIVVKNCYQEQVMQVFNQLGGIELSNAYKLIKAISKKNTEIIAKFKPDFLKGTMEKGVSKDKAEEIFDFILKFGGYGFNKCVVGGTVVFDAATGRRATVNELFHEHRAGGTRPFQVHALGDDGKLRPRAVTDVMWNGRKRVYEVVTAQGKRITATDNHPFRTLDGWTNLGDLKVGARVAAPRRMTVTTTVTTAATMPRHELIVLAGLLAEGNTCHPSCLYFFGNDRVLVDDFASAAGQFPQTVARTYARADGRRMEVCVSTGRDARFRPGHGSADRTAGVATIAPPSRSGAFRWAEAIGIVGLKATEKHVPGIVFELCDADVELFLGRLWAGDGFLANATQAVPFYATSSPRLARDVQSLLLRLGIVSGVHAKRFKYRGGERPGYTVHLLGDGSIRTFIGRVAPHCLGREAAVSRLSAYVASVGPDRSSKDTVPAEVRAWVDAERRGAGLTWDELQARSGVCVKELCYANPNKAGFRRSTVAKLATFFGSARLSAAAASDVFWDRVVSIEPKGVQDTYDLTVDVDHNFVADGLVVHNSHSARYAIVAYQTAYMKTYHPVEYMSAVLTFEMGTTEKVVEYIDECRRMTPADGTKGIKVLPPDVNVSAKDFTPVYTLVEEKKIGRAKPKARVEGVIRFGLAAVRGVGEKAVETIAAERAAKGDYPNLYDFCERVDLRAVPRATIEALVKCGAFASTGANRAQLMQVVDQAFETGQQTQADRRNGQMSMFGGTAAAAGPSAAALMGGTLPDAEEFENAELLKFEKELLGFYITSHPLTDHQVNLERFSTASTKEAQALPEGNEVMIGGMIARVKKVVTKNGRSAGMQMAIVTLEDLDGTIDGTMFAETFAAVTAAYPDAIAADRMVFVKGKVDKKRETPSLLINEVIPVSDAVAKLTTAVCLRLDSARHDAAVLTDVPGVLARHKGTTPVYFQVTTAQGKAMLSVDKQHGVRPSPALVDDIEHLLGHGSVDLAGAGSKRRKRLEQARLFKDEAAADDAPAVATDADPLPEAELEDAGV